MMIGISIRSPAIDSSRAFSSFRSGERGAYDLTGSFTGGGTCLTAVNPVRPALACAALAAAAALFVAVLPDLEIVGADMVRSSFLARSSPPRHTVADG
jgi:hypothetical protein